MEFPTVEEVLALHDQILEATGGTPGVLVRGGIESAIERCKWGPFLRPARLSSRAALLLRGICQDHPLADGNKRTGYGATHAFLLRNGFELEATADEVVAFMLQVAQAQADLD
ncbi:MAG TPA: type II toxin-antitoxin system death-on-curing family toxin [Candidatus Thermoplasmatota archaeon]|nr:type II toxin-antitoxin system death-on-curing family toxin [Candidatus Thermoplasmatota archaeon]